MPARHRARLILPAAAPLLALVAGCSGGAVKQTVKVDLTASDCGLSSSTLQAGRTAFAVDNHSGKEAEFYVYTAAGDKVDEVEGIADSTTRTLKVSLDGGRYEAACKPEGGDNRTPFTVK